MADVIAELVGRLGYEVDDKGLAKFEDGTEKADKSAKGLVETLSHLTTIGRGVIDVVSRVARELTGLITGAAETGDEIAKTAGKIGITTTELQRLRFAAARSGAEATVLNDGIRKLNQGLVEATSKGTGPFAEGLKILGVSLDDLRDLSQEQRFGFLADELANVADASTRSALAAKLFGETAGPGLLPLLNAGSEGIRALGDRAEELGGVLSEDALRNAEAFQDALLDLKTTGVGVGGALLGTLAPVITDVANRTADWIAENRELVQQKVAEFIDEASRVLGELVPKLVDMAGAVVDLAEPLGGLESDLTLATAAAFALSVAIGGIPGLALAAGAAVGLLAADVAGFTDEIAAFRQQRKLVERDTERVRAGNEALDELSALLDDPQRLASMSDADYARLVDDVIVGTSGDPTMAEAGDAVIRRIDSERALAKAEAFDPTIGVTPEVDAAASRAGRRREIDRRMRSALKPKGKGGGGRETDTTLARERFGDRIAALGATSGATETAQDAALKAAAESLDRGASDEVAFGAAVGQLESLTGRDLSGQGLGLHDALAAAIMGGGRAPGEASALAGAQFVRIEQHYNAPTEVSIEINAEGLDATAIVTDIEERIGAALDERNRQAFDHFRAAVEI